ncbi:hypothetical protein TREES_T100017955 [Tupaia chinensis]|uniref:Uncharacterized protein n=1 Tax=Tupaia chinensis TaxID=246437 RepID=L9JUB1_TUPCH|nr:hypothetical protein TREES_T100017955 [Tupaia chinensis]
MGVWVLKARTDVNRKRSTCEVRTCPLYQRVTGENTSTVSEGDRGSAAGQPDVLGSDATITPAIDME